MQYNSLIDNVTSKKWGLNLQEAYLFSYLITAAGWAEKKIIGQDVYYFVSKTIIKDELPLLSNKIDTIYRYYKSLQEKEVIILKKISGKDYVTFLEKASSWNNTKEQLGFKSETDTNSENNPNLLGFKSETHSDLNPTYQSTIYDHSTNTYKDFVTFLNKEVSKKYQGSDKIQQSFKARISEGRTLEDFKTAITNAKVDDYHIKNGFKHLTLEFFTRADKLDKWLNASAPKTPAQIGAERIAAFARESEFNNPKQ